MKKNIFLLFNLFFVLIYCSCDFNSTYPFVISKIEQKIGFQKGICNYASIYFDFYNATKENIQSIEFVFFIYSEDNALCKNGLIKSKYENNIDPQEKIKLVLSLDNLILKEPSQNFIINNFFIKRIIYSNGKIWNNYIIFKEESL